MSKIGTKIEENDNTKINHNAFLKMIDKMNLSSSVYADECYLIDIYNKVAVSL